MSIKCMCFIRILHEHWAVITQLNYCELAELASLCKARELMYRYMGKQNNWMSQKTKGFWNMVHKSINCFFYPRIHFHHEATRPDLTRPDSVRPDHEAIWWLIWSRKLSSVRRELSDMKVKSRDKFHELYFQNGIYDTFRVSAFSVKPVFSLIFKVFLAYLFTEIEC